MAVEKVKGLAQAYALFDGLPSSAQAELESVIHDIGEKELAAQRADVARRTGALSEALSVDETIEQLRVRIGLIGRARDFWYGRIVEFGRKAQVVNVTRRAFRSGGRRRRRAVGIAAAYQMRVSALAPRPFIFKDRPELDAVVTQRLAEFWSNAFARAGGDTA